MLTVFAGLAGLGLGLSLITTTMLLTQLNPHVYIDTVVMLASIAATHGDERWLFAGGAVAASLVWFVALGFGATRLSGVLRTEKAWRIIDALIALVMCAIALSLVSPLLVG